MYNFFLSFSFCRVVAIFQNTPYTKKCTDQEPVVAAPWTTNKIPDCTNSLINMTLWQL